MVSPFFICKKNQKKNVEILTFKKTIHNFTKLNLHNKHSF